MLQQAIERVGKIDREAVIKDLQTGTFDTVIGKVKLENNMPTRYWWVGQWQGGEFYGVGPAGNESARAAGRAKAGVEGAVIARHCGLRLKGDDERGPHRPLLGGMYALIAMGLTLQYGVARIMNLSYGEFLVAAAFASYWLFTGWALNPLLASRSSFPLSFGVSYCSYRVLLTPLVRRAPDARRAGGRQHPGHVRHDVHRPGHHAAMFGGAYFSYSFLAIPVTVFGETLALNRLIAFGLAVVFGLALYLALTRTRIGTAIRAVAVDPVAAQLVAIDVTTISALAFALGGAMVAAAGVLISMFLTFSASSGVVFTMKALIVVVMGGVGNLLGASSRASRSASVNPLVATFVDPGLTLAVNFALFLGVLLVKPAGLFGRAQR